MEVHSFWTGTLSTPLPLGSPMLDHCFGQALISCPFVRMSRNVLAPGHGSKTVLAPILEALQGRSHSRKVPGSTGTNQDYFYSSFFYL